MNDKYHNYAELIGIPIQLILRDGDFQPRLAKKPDYDAIDEEDENTEMIGAKSTYNGRSLEQVGKIFKSRVCNF